MVTQQGRRVLILDTSVFVHDPNCIEGFPPGDVLVLASWVVDKLDDLKRSEGERGEHALRALRNILEYSVHGKLNDITGVVTRSGSILKAGYERELPKGIELNADNKTIFLAKDLQRKSPDVPVIVISKEIKLRIKASMLGVRSGDYEGESSLHDPYAIFPGCSEIILNCSQPVDELHRNLRVDVHHVTSASSFALDTLIPNQCVFFRFDNKDTLAIYKKSEKIFRLVPKPKANGKQKSPTNSISPANCEQAFAHSLLMDSEIKLVALVGTAGSGKTLMSLLGAKDQVKTEFERGTKTGSFPEFGIYDKITIFRPNIELGHSLGFLPGTLDEKYEPWTQPIRDNLELIIPNSNMRANIHKHYDPMNDLLESGVLEISPINHVRGRSIHHRFMIVDEAQNLSRHHIKSLITRAGKGTKIVLTGDISQIDDPYLDQSFNGLSYAISQFMGQEIFGYTIMKKGEERSVLAKLASELL